MKKGCAAALPQPLGAAGLLLAATHDWGLVVDSAAMDSRPSATALRVAMRRAAHQILDRPLVFEDPLALSIIGPRRAEIVRSGDPREVSAFGRALRAFLAARSRYTEETLDASVALGVRQYVILGAGLDMSAYRARDPALKCFEVDHPATQAWKREMLAHAGIPIPESLSFVPVDFESQSLDEELRKAGLDFSRPAFVSWLGVVPYLSRDTVLETLASIARLPQDSAIVFDYGIPPSRLRWRERLVASYVSARVAAAGEPWKTFFDAEELASELSKIGFRRTTDLEPAEINALYFARRTDGLRVGSMGHLARAER